MKKIIHILLLVFLCFNPFLASQTARELVHESGFKGGVILHIGSGTGERTCSLYTDSNALIHGMDKSDQLVNQARAHAYSKKVSDKVTFSVWKNENLPFAENFANLIIAETEVDEREIKRVLAPYGTAYLKNGDKWKKLSKTFPTTMDHWPQHFYSPTGNSVSKDKQVKPPLYHLKWTGGPRWSRHHDVMSSFTACVSAGGRLFYIFDEGNTFSPMMPTSWKLIARDAFNGTILWKRDIPKWFPNMQRLKSGPSNLPRRIVATNDRIYVTLGIEAPISVLDAKTGKTIEQIKGTEGTEEIILENDDLYIIADKEEKKLELQKYPYSLTKLQQRPKEVIKVNRHSLKTEWNSKATWSAPLSLCTDEKRTFYFDGKSIIALNKNDGSKAWISKELPLLKTMNSWFGPTMVTAKNRVFYTGGENYKGHVGSMGKLFSLDANTGDFLWESDSPPSGYKSPENLFVIKGMVWQNDNTGRVDGGDGTPSTGITTAKGFEMGKDQVSFGAPEDAYWFHHRCYPAKATEDYLLLSRTGIEFVDLKTKQWTLHHWVRGACLYGILPANGLVYAPPHPCACYVGAKLNGFTALAGYNSANPVFQNTPDEHRLIKGTSQVSKYRPFDQENSWPMYRHNNLRSGTSSSQLLSSVNKSSWSVKLGGNLTPPVIANNTVVVAQKNLSTIHAFDQSNGKALWKYNAGGRIDSSPTLHNNRCYFGGTDGFVYCLDLMSGKLVWKFQAAPSLAKHMYFEHLESTHPLHGSVIIRDEKLYAVAGRSMFVDGGMVFYALDAKSGQIITKKVMDDKVPETGEPLQLQHEVLSMPQALNDLLSCDDQRIYMRKQDFDFEGTRLGLKNARKVYGKNPAEMQVPFEVYDDQVGMGARIISGTGYLDDSWWHRTYWSYGKNYTSGYNGYFQAGRNAPSGRIMSFDKNGVFAFGRMNQYYRWSTIYEYYLFHRDYDNKEKWGVKVPILVRAMTLTKDKLYALGPDEVINQKSIAKVLNLPTSKQKVQDQDDAFKGKKGAKLLIVDRKNGLIESALHIPTTPVFDGMSSAYQKLFISLSDGSLMCISDRGEDLNAFNQQEIASLNEAAKIVPPKPKTKKKKS